MVTELALEAAIQRLEHFDLLTLDDLAYVAKDQAETSVLFELISARYEQRSLLITANLLCGAPHKVQSVIIIDSRNPREEGSEDPR